MADPQLDVGLLHVGPEATNEPDLLKYFLNEDVLDGDFSKVPRSSPQDSPHEMFDSPETSPLPPLSSSSDLFLDPVFQTQLNGGLSYYDQSSLFDNVVLSVKDGNPLDLDDNDVDITGNKKRKIPNIANPKTPLTPLARSMQPVGAPVDDERVQKRQKRLIKNRESAQLSRLRKKLYIEDLERKVCTLTSENEALSKKIQTLSDELMYLRSSLKSSGATSALSATGTGGMFKKPIFNNKNGSAAGICLLIVLFSFGLVFNAQIREGGPMFPSSKRDPVPDVVPPSQRVLTSIKEEKTEDSTSIRDLIDIFPSSQPHVKIGPSSAPLEKELDPAGKRLQPERPFDRAVVKSDPAESGLPMKRIKTEPVDDRENRGLVPIRITPSTGSGTSKEDLSEVSTEVRYPNTGNALSVVERHNSTSLQARGPPTSYIYCSEAQEIVVTQGNSNEPPTIALLLPAGVLNSTVIPMEHQDSDNTMVEVSCQVLNIHVWQVSTEPSRV